MTRSPVLLIAFNRPDAARRAAELIAQAGPPKVYLAIDGPRNEAEAAVVDETYEAVAAVLARHDTPTIVSRQPSNLGCKRGVEAALDWFFGIEDEGIVLEDDCHPSPAFFRFCDQMLEDYRSEARVMHIGGYTEQGGSHDYRFSRFPAVWGWATWARAWSLHQPDLPDVNAELFADMRDKFDRREHLDFFMRRWSEVSRGAVDTWDFGWLFTVRRNDGLAVQPTINLVHNAGMGDERATHTRRPVRTVERNVAQNPELRNFSGPPKMAADDRADHAFFRSRIAGRLSRIRSLRRRRDPWHAN